MGHRSLRFLMTIAEVYPTHRPDVRVLFGKYLARAGIGTDILGVTSEDQPEAWPAGSLELRRVGGRLSTLLGDLRQELKLFSRARQGYDGVIVRDKPVLGLIGLLAARLAGIPFVYWMSFPYPELWFDVASRPGISRARRIYAWVRGVLARTVLYRVLLNRADWLFVQSRLMHERMREQGLAHDRVTEVPMGADLENQVTADPGLVPAEFAGRRVAVYLGVLERIRRPEVMIDAAVQVGRLYPDFLLAVIGDVEEPADRGWLQQYAVERGADAFCMFLGRLPFDQAQAIAARAEIGLSPVARHPLLEVGSPTKAVEYMSLGLAVVGNEQPDQADAIRGSGAGRCVPLDGEAFAAAIVELLGDPAEMARVRSAGRPWVERHRSYRILGDLVATSLRSVAAAGRTQARRGEAAPVSRRGGN